MTCKRNSIELLYRHKEGMNTEIVNYLANDLVAFKNGLDVFHFHLS